MTEIRLDRLTLEHFKGVKSFTLEPKGNCTVRGPNGSGKTTLMDGFLWLLFGKDSTGRADFDIKTLTPDGKAISNLNHAVEAVLTLAGSQRTITLRKVYAEKWTKRRGSAAKEFSGHSTDHFIDGVPIQQKEWTQRINALVEEETFRLLTNPDHFANLHWQKRREILLQVCGDVPDEAVIASEDALRELPEILGGRTQDEHRKVLASRRREINAHLTEIPARIDELLRTVADIDVANLNRSAIEALAKELSEKIQDMKVDHGAAQIRAQRADLVAKLTESRSRLDAARREAESVIVAEICRLEDEKRQNEREVSIASITIRENETVIANGEREMDRLRADFGVVSAQEYSGPFACPACGQALPGDQVESARLKHNELKARKLAAINAEGVRLKGSTEEAKKDLSRQSDRKDLCLRCVAELDSKIQAARERKAGVIEEAEADERGKMDALESEIAALDKTLASRTLPDTSVLEAQLAGERQKINAIDSAGRTTERIEALKVEEKTLAAEFEEMERQLDMLDRFVVAKVNLLETKINSRFELVRFKLFDQQVNGGICECCEATVNGVPFSSANTGSQIMAGLDIINTLSSHYKIRAPVFLDHRESLTSEPKTSCQLICLAATDTIKTMEVSHQ